MRSKSVKFEGPLKTARLLPWTVGTTGTKKIKSDVAVNSAFIDKARINEHTLTIELMDARTLQVPTVGLGDVAMLPFPEICNFCISSDGQALVWPALNCRITLRQLMGIE